MKENPAKKIKLADIVRKCAELWKATDKEIYNKRASDINQQRAAAPNDVPAEANDAPAALEDGAEEEEDGDLGDLLNEEL